MRKYLLDKLIKEDNGNIKTFFDDIEDGSYKKLSTSTLFKLLQIKDIKSRYEALEAITYDSPLKNNENYINFILLILKNVTDALIADIVHFTAIDINLLSSNEIRYKQVLFEISELKESKRANSISNIFCNKKILDLDDETYFSLLMYAIHSYNIERLEEVENSIYKGNSDILEKEIKLIRAIK